MNETGNIGIGTATPGAKLEVLSGGGIHITDDSLGRTLIIKPSLSGAIHEFTSDNTAAGYSFSNNSSEFMRIAADGNVGIGTTSPTHKLHVAGSVNIEDDLTFGIGGFLGTSSSVFEMFSLGDIIYNADSNNNGTSNHIFRESGNELMRITSGGNVGIGTASPLVKLDVSGTVRAGGKITYTKSYPGGLDTTGVAVAGLLSSYNGSSASFVFEMHGGTGGYQRVVYSCYNASGIWYAKNVINEGTNNMDVVASANASTITFTFKSLSGTLAYTPYITVEQIGAAIDTQYL